LFLRIVIREEKSAVDALSTIATSSRIQQIVFCSLDQGLSADYLPSDYCCGQLDSAVVDLSMEHLPSVGLGIKAYTEHASYLPRLHSKNLVSMARASFS
jgi:hypothetical protein